MINRLKELRVEKGFTQKEIAIKLSLTQQTYSDYETGRTDPDIETLISMGDILEVSIDYLLGREDDFGNVHVQGTAPQLTAAERQLLEDFRSLSPDLQDMLTATIETWKKKSSNAVPKAKRA